MAKKILGVTLDYSKVAFLVGFGIFLYYFQLLLGELLSRFVISLINLYKYLCQNYITIQFILIFDLSILNTTSIN
jgi:hypothetical protein